MAEVAKKENAWSMIKLGLVLCAYAVAACAMLAIVNNFTAPKIAQNQERKVSAAMQEFFPDNGLTFETVKDFTPPVVGAITVDEMYVAKRGNEIVGGAAQVSGPTYDQGTILIGVKTDGTVTGLKFLKLTDSPGFGLKANDATFKLPNGKTPAHHHRRPGQWRGTRTDCVRRAQCCCRPKGDCRYPGHQAL